MKHKYVAIEKKAEIAFITLDRPPGNRLNQELFTELPQTLKEVDLERETRVIIVRGAGENFCVGADVAEIVTLDKAGCRNFFLGLNKMYKTFHSIDKLTIAMVQGYATAGGMGIVSSCDLAVVSEDAHFGTTAVNVGLFCMSPTAAMLPRVVGRKKALEMGLTGQIINAKEAARLGIVNMVCPRKELESTTMELAQRILSKNPISIVMGRRNFYTCADMEYDKALEHSAEMLGILAATEEAKERMRAFLEKREPKW
jgi:enoyl-CoA hydratase/carnithine racemase